MGLENIVYQVPENTSVAQACAIVFSPNIPCQIESNFTVNLSISDGSAGIHLLVHRDRNTNRNDDTNILSYGVVSMY